MNPWFYASMEIMSMPRWMCPEGVLLWMLSISAVQALKMMWVYCECSQCPNTATTAKVGPTSAPRNPSDKGRLRGSLPFATSHLPEDNRNHGGWGRRGLRSVATCALVNQFASLDAQIPESAITVGSEHLSQGTTTKLSHCQHCRQEQD